jgi:hypothetical protein
MPRRSPLLAAKERARRAHTAARGGDSRSAALYDRWFAETLSNAAGRDEDVAIAMFTRLAIALEVMIDMKGWPGRPGAGRHRVAQTKLSTVTYESSYHPLSTPLIPG